MLRLLTKNAPVVACFMVLLSILFPVDGRKDFRHLQKQFTELKQENDTLRNQFAATLDFLRSGVLYSNIVAEVSQQLPSSGCAGTLREEGASASLRADCRSFMAHGEWKLASGNFVWGRGDDSPWGYVQSVFAGGFLADGVRYTTLPTVQERVIDGI